MSGSGLTARLGFFDPVAAHLRRITGPLRDNRRFRRYFIANQVNAAGTTMEVGALAFTVLASGGGPSGIAMVLMANMVTGILVSPLAGVAADRLPRAAIIAVVQVIIGLVTVTECVVIFAGRAQVWNLAALAATNSAAASFSSPAQTGLMSVIVPKDQLGEANALAQLSRHTIVTIGPAIGGTIVATAGAGYGVGLNATSFFASALLIAGIRAPRVPRQVAGIRADLIEGWRAVRTRSWIWTCLTGTAVMVPAWHIGYGILGPPWAKAHFGGAWAWGLIASSLGCGMAAGAAVSLLWRPRRAGWVNCLGAAALAIPDPLMAAGAPLPVVMAAVVVAAAGLSVSTVVWQTAVQQLVPVDQQGRVSAFVSIGEISLAPAGYLLVAPATGAIGVRGTLLGCGLVLAVANLAPLCSRDVRALTLLDTPPREDKGTTDAISAVP
ncbi:MFS transporter [Actinoallomurus iriomotensis]|uniref:MFS transporter n=1 Tax=Actinoallomurus iriomotensis TaxID=478107 RepID=A0A9W6RMU6_9ACTN|nr:MFS transporter [Actinoallomurus iriomotensis]GLY78015.1 MFS transporter [Actinoallomurus iriomotensis]